MIFSSIPFLYYFLPIVVMLYFVVPRNMANSVLLLASLFFYGYGEPKMLLVMVATIIFSWALGLKIPEKKWLTAVSVVVSLGVLVWFKYMGFFVESFSDAFGVEVEFMNIALPAGISFYTFQTLSYTIDLGRGRIQPQKSLLDFAMYVALFP
ncbi:MAG: MBOAT family protein, partial [Firmicutes bacterium]|nr:MBOAT family protein [Bacillota bacterium]